MGPVSHIVLTDLGHLNFIAKIHQFAGTYALGNSLLRQGSLFLKVMLVLRIGLIFVLLFVCLTDHLHGMF